MTTTENIRDTAIELGQIYSRSPTDYFYLKGWIHCLLQKENDIYKKKPTKPTKEKPA